MSKTWRIAVIAFLLPILVFGACKNAPDTPVNTALPRGVPEAEGVSSEDLIAFLDSLSASRNEFHSFMLVRHGRVIAEGWWDPYKPELRHTLYSTSKSFTSTAVGFAVSEKKMSVDDKVISFFPQDLPDTVSPFLADMTVKDLLTMSAGQDPDPTFPVVLKDSNWVKAFLALPVINDPGTRFLYNSLATYMLSAIVQQVTGEKVIDYLTPRLFDPLGIQGFDWEVDPRGINTGGWGLRLKTEDMAKFGQLYLQKGMWNGKQVLPAVWINEATSFKIDQAPDAPQSGKDSSDWMQGYCYQFWRCRNKAYRADGAYGQFIIVMPEQDAVIAIQAESPDMQDEINLIWKCLLPALRDDELLANPAMAGELNRILSLLALPLPEKSIDSPVASMISGKTFAFEPNDGQMESIAFHFTNDTCRVTLRINNKDYDHVFGKLKWITGETEKLGPNLFFLAKAHYIGLPPAKVAGCFSWKDDKTVELALRYIESPHTERLTCRFDGDKISVNIQYSNAPTVRGRHALTGKMMR